jgi:AcrR family transcriptional regulator
MAATASKDAVPARGRPRSERSRRAIMRAASELMLERDPGEITVEAIAERAGASKATIYRWWGSKERLMLEALRAQWDEAVPAEIDTGSLEGDLLELIQPWAARLATRAYGRVFAAFIASAHRDPAFAAEYRTHFVAARRERADGILRRAIERGQIPPDTDVEAAMDLLYGPMYHRALHGHGEIDADFVRTIVHYVVAALTAPKRG